MKIGNFETHSAESIQPMKDIRAMFVGRKGSGKSNAAVSLADFKNTKKKAHVIDLDIREQSLRGREGVEVIQFTKKHGYEHLQDYLHECSKLVDKGLYQEQFGLTLFSSTTSLQTFLTKDSLKYIGAKGDGDGSRGAQTIGKMVIPGIRNYLYTSEGVENIILQQLFYLPGHLIIEGHIVNHYNSKNEVDGETLLGTDKIAERIPSFFNEVWKFEKREGASAQLPPTYHCIFKSNMADTTYKQLPKEIDITGVNFYHKLKSLLEVKEG